MLSVVQRASRDSYEAPIINKRASAGSFSNVSADTIRRLYKLPANSVARERVPTDYDIPNQIR